MPQLTNQKFDAKNMRPTRTALLARAALLLTCCHAMDVKLKSISCDKSLPVYISSHNFQITCNGKRKCTFGDYARAQGQIIYNGVDEMKDTPVTIKGAFGVSTDVVDVPEGTTVYLCGSSIEPVDSSMSCPQDGAYNFVRSFTIPYYEGSWLATGWPNSGHFYLHSSENILIGSCQLRYTTEVTSNRLIHKPSAGHVAVLLAIGLAGGVLFLSYFLCMQYKKRMNQHASDSCASSCADSSYTTGGDFSSMDDTPPPQTIIATPITTKRAGNEQARDVEEGHVNNSKQLLILPNERKGSKVKRFFQKFSRRKSSDPATVTTAQDTVFGGVDIDDISSPSDSSFSTRGGGWDSSSAESSFYS